LLLPNEFLLVVADMAEQTLRPARAFLQGKKLTVITDRMTEFDGPIGKSTDFSRSVRSDAEIFSRMAIIRADLCPLLGLINSS